MFKLSAVLLSVLWSFDVPCRWCTPAYASFMAFHILASLYAVDSPAFSYKQSRFGRACWGLVLGLVYSAGKSREWQQPKSKLKSLETKQVLIEGSAAVVNDQIKAESVTVECERGGLVHSDASDASSAGWQCGALVLASAAILDNPSNQNILIS